jgi:FkbM family methyltransferase
MIIPALLKIEKLRAKFIHSIKQNYFDELDISIPIDNEYWAKLFRNDSYDSFSEIFIQNEYAGFIPDIEINRVIDLGAHHGFFSVWLQSNRPPKKIKSLLVEPSARCFPVLSELTKRKEYNNFTFFNKCIGDPEEGENLFFDRPHMAASKYKNDDTEVPEKVSVLTPKDIFEWQQPPYDLLKCDIEGAEFSVFKHYTRILLNTKFIILEWHDRKSVKLLKNEFINLNFSIIKNSVSDHSIESDKINSGIFLAKNNNLSMNE